jgi:A/G-specific adenine glycosylase
LLGGMTEVPTTAWSERFDQKSALRAAPEFAKRAVEWQRRPGVVMHTFTHFPLELVVYAARVTARTAAPAGHRWVKAEELASEALPSLMRKVLAHARSE